MRICLCCIGIAFGLAAGCGGESSSTGTQGATVVPDGGSSPQQGTHTRSVTLTDAKGDAAWVDMVGGAVRETPKGYRITITRAKPIDFQTVSDIDGDTYGVFLQKPDEDDDNEDFAKVTIYSRKNVKFRLGKYLTKGHPIDGKIHGRTITMFVPAQPGTYDRVNFQSETARDYDVMPDDGDDTTWSDLS